MGFSIGLDEDTARRLHQEAVRRNVDAGALGAAFVRERLPQSAPVEFEVSPAGQMAAFRVAVAEIEEFGRQHPLPSLPDEALARESLYADHD